MSRRPARPLAEAVLAPGLLAPGLLALGILTASGCAAPFDKVDFCVINSQPGASVSDRSITIPKGTVVALKTSPIGTDGDIMDDDLAVDLESSNPSVLGAAPLDYESDSCPGYDNVDWYFVLYGVETGQTTLKVWVRNRLRLEIPVNVVNP